MAPVAPDVGEVSLPTLLPLPEYGAVDELEPHPDTARVAIASKAKDARLVSPFIIIPSDRSGIAVAFRSGHLSS